MVAQAPQSGDAIVLSLVGEFRVARAGRTLSAPEIGSRKARTLLKLLAIGRGGWMHVDQIVDVLWPAESPQRPTEGVATLVSRLRASLGDAIVDGDHDGYRLGRPPLVDVDLAAAERHVVEARRRSTTGDTGLASGAATRALAILGDGRVLVADAGADWAEPARTLAVELLREARGLAASAALAIGEPAAARDIARAAVTADGFDEPAIRLLISNRHRPPSRRSVARWPGQPSRCSRPRWRGGHRLQWSSRPRLCPGDLRWSSPRPHPY